MLPLPLLLLLEFDSPSSIWIGATDQEEEGVWLWDTGERVDMDRATWASKRPNRDGSMSHPWFDCTVAYSGTGVYRMNDQPCKIFKNFLCQFDLI